MKKTIFSSIVIAMLAISSVVAPGCGQSYPNQQYVPAQTQQVQVPPACVENYSLQEVLAGIHGVDAYGRPLNACGYPVNVYGEPIESVPSPEVFYHRPTTDYLTWLSIHYAFYHPIWGVSFYHPYCGARVIVHRTYITTPIRPTVSYSRSTITVTTHRPSTTVRPGAPSTSTVRPGVSPTSTIRPGAGNYSGTPNTTVRPPSSNAPSLFNRKSNSSGASNSFRPSTGGSSGSRFRRR